jgi:hypothetical protein
VALKGKTRKRIEKDLEKYVQVLDDILTSLTKMREIKRSKINLSLAVTGILILALGGVTAIYTVSADFQNNQMLTAFGIIGIFIGVLMIFIGYIIAHRGFTGYWL